MRSSLARVVAVVALAAAAASCTRPLDTSGLQAMLKQQLQAELGTTGLDVTTVELPVPVEIPDATELSRIRVGVPRQLNEAEGIEPGIVGGDFLAGLVLQTFADDDHAGTVANWNASAVEKPNRRAAPNAPNGRHLPKMSAASAMKPRPAVMFSAHMGV